LADDAEHEQADLSLVTIHREGHGRHALTQANEHGNKGSSLRAMAQFELSNGNRPLLVPPGFILPVAVHDTYRREGRVPEFLRIEIQDAIARVYDEWSQLARTFPDGCPIPFAVSVRSGAPDSMPGQMETILNVGLCDPPHNDAPEEARRLWYASHAQYVSSIGWLLHLLKPPVNGTDSPPEELSDDALHAGFVRPISGLHDVEDCIGTAALTSQAYAEVDALLMRRYQALYDQGLAPPKAIGKLEDQILHAIKLVYASWDSERASIYRERESLAATSTAVIIQLMVYGNLTSTSASGVAFSRDPNSGEPHVTGELIVRAQGDSVVAGARPVRQLSDLDESWDELRSALKTALSHAERLYQNVVEVEFTWEAQKLWLLQARVAKRSGLAAFKVAYDISSEKKGGSVGLGGITALNLLKPNDVDRLLNPRLAPHSSKSLATGLPASPGAAVGTIFLSSKALTHAYREWAKSAKDRRDANPPQWILVRPETSPDDVEAMRYASGIVTARGGVASHAAVVARGLNKPTIVGASELRLEADSLHVGGTRIPEGDSLSIDGNSGELFDGALQLEPGAPTHEFLEVMNLVEGFLVKQDNPLFVRANASHTGEFEAACNAKAQGVGLCRSERAFEKGGGAKHYQGLLKTFLTTSCDRSDHVAAREELRDALEAQSHELLARFPHQPVAIRFLDPALGEWFPAGLRESSASQESRVSAQNPVLGIRGVRLAFLYPELYKMQIDAILRAVARRVAEGAPLPELELIVPMVVTAREVERVKRLVDERLVAFRRLVSVARNWKVTVGAMVETPAALLNLVEIATESDFISLGTNDLTQLVYGFSRDDLEGELMPTYLQEGVLRKNPFQTIDENVVGIMISDALEKVRKKLGERYKVAAAGEHASDPESIPWFVGQKLSYISVSGNRSRLFAARIAVAQAALKGQKTKR
jgi:pyruvate,orthophosphate dikinase